MPYSSMESIIEANKDAYYRALRNTQKTIWKDKINYEPWLTLFVSSLVKQKRILESKAEKLTSTNKNSLSATPTMILKLFAQKPEMSMAEIVSAASKNPETVRKAVQSLVNKGYLRKQGSTKGAFYILVRQS